MKASEASGVLGLASSAAISSADAVAAPGPCPASPVGSRDQLGMAANWGRPNEDTFGPDLDDQYTFEVYYRLQVTDQFALTPDIQFMVDPAQNPTEDSLWIFGLRARLAL